jgi:hypothetical protein
MNNTLTTVKNNLADLYSAVLAGTVDIKTAGELANIAGKQIKIEQLEFAKEVFAKERPAAITLEG